METLETPETEPESADIPETNRSTDLGYSNAGFLLHFSESQNYIRFTTRGILAGRV